MKMEHAGNAEASDEAKLVAAATGDPTLFGPLYERYVGQIYGYVHRRVGNHSDAEDVTSQTFQQALAALSDYQPRDVPFSEWLYGIARDVLSHRSRAAQHEVDEGPNTSGMGDDAEELTAIDSERQEGEIMAAVRLLPPDEQRVIVLRFSRGMTGDKIAEVIGCDEGMAKNLLYRALVSLRAALENSAHG